MPSLFSRSALRVTLPILALAAIGVSAGLNRLAAASTTEQDVVVYSYLTDEGRKLTPPTADKPAYYQLIDGGYRALGSTIAGEKKPDRNEIEKLVRRALATNHYLGVSSSTPQMVVKLNGQLTRTARIDLVIVYYWGYLTRDQIDSDDPETPATDLNSSQTIGLVGGKKLADMLPQESGRAELMQAAGVDRYFVIVSAFDLKSLVKKKKLLLWRAQISGSMSGTTLDAVVPGFMAAAAPFLGRETDIPRLGSFDLGQNAHVEIGTPQVEEYLPAVQLPDAPMPAKKERK